MEKQKKIEKMAKNYETYGEFVEALRKDGLDIIVFVVKSWMNLNGVKPEDKIPNDWKRECDKIE